MNVSSPFIQSVYSCRVRTPANGSACAEKLASGVQYAWHTSQPFPASHVSKNRRATSVMVDMFSPAIFPLAGRVHRRATFGVARRGKLPGTAAKDFTAVLGYP